MDRMLSTDGLSALDKCRWRLVRVLPTLMLLGFVILLTQATQDTWGATKDIPSSSVQIDVALQGGARAIVRERYVQVRSPAFVTFQYLIDRSAEIQRIVISRNGAENEFTQSTSGPWVILTLKSSAGIRSSPSDFEIYYDVQLYDQDSHIPIVMPAQPLPSDQEWGTRAIIQLHVPSEYLGGRVRLPQMEGAKGSGELVGSFPALPSIIWFHFPTEDFVPRSMTRPSPPIPSFLERQFYPFLVLQVLWVIFYFRWARASAGGRPRSARNM